MPQRHRSGRLGAIVPSRPPSEPAGPGLFPLGIGGVRDGLIYAPPGLDPEQPAPLVLMLHGAGGSGYLSLPRLRPLADERGLLLLAVDARSDTWDAMLGGYGPDVAFIDAALARVFASRAVDPRRVVAEGFSDGASYALGLGLANGDLFTHVVAFSPGFMPPAKAEGTPRVFISHGTGDQILPIDACSRRIVPALKRRRYDVHYLEFAGGHEVPSGVASQAARWLLG